MYLLDTNICIYIMKDSFPSLTEKVFSFDPSDIFISSVTVFELEYGAAKRNWGEKARQKMHMFKLSNVLEAFELNDRYSRTVL